jgi:hypothetical protein
MKRVLAQVLALFVVSGAIVLYAVVAGANTSRMAQLPLSTPFGCANCHAGATAISVPADHPLNPFGLDFQANGSWTPTLAALDSDGDGCANGAEIGDADGNGHPDSNVTQESSNPGVPDCTNVTNEKTWGELKSLFNSR